MGKEVTVTERRRREVGGGNRDKTGIRKEKITKE